MRISDWSSDVCSSDLDAAVVEVLVLLMVADVPPSVPFAIFAVKILTELGDLTLVQPSGPVMVPESRTARCSNSRSPTTDAGRSTLKLVALEGNEDRKSVV